MSKESDCRAVRNAIYPWSAELRNTFSAYDSVWEYIGVHLNLMNARIAKIERRLNDPPRLFAPPPEALRSEDV
jgi:hypothetical protein